MRFRWKLLVLLLLIAVGPILVMRTIGVRTLQRMGAELVNRERLNVLAATDNHLRTLQAHYAARLAQSKRRMELAVLLLANAANQAVACRTNPASDPSGGFAGSAPAGPARVELGASLGEALQRIVPHMDVMPVRYEVTVDGRPLVFDASGDQVVEPAPPSRGGTVPSAADAVHWSEPTWDGATGALVMTIAARVAYPDGRPAGRAAVVVPVARLMGTGPPPPSPVAGTRFILVWVPDGGPVPVAEEASGRGWIPATAPLPLERPAIPRVQDLIDALARSQGGMQRITGAAGEDDLWHYRPLDHDLVLVMITPYARVRDASHHAVNYVRGLMREVLLATRSVVVVLAVLVVLVALIFARSVTRPLLELVGGAHRLAAGRLDARVRIRSRDEFGDLGKVFNSVVPRLEEHYRMRQTLLLATEVQQNLLPSKSPRVAGLDVAGTSVYCDGAGGDYYDYLMPQPAREGRLDIVVGDVAGHGIASALLMTTARALVRQRALQGGGPGAILRDVNRNLVPDTEPDGQFMTLFYAAIDTEAHQVAWVRAGHEPALIYDPVSDRFEALTGSGLPLGIDAAAAYATRRCPLRPGQLLFVGTDGIWETGAPTGEVFGKGRVQALIRRHAHERAADLVAAVLEATDRFRAGGRREDDLTLVVVKRNAEC